MRKQNWEQILAEKIKEKRAEEFYWGESDCIYWTSDVIKAITGETPVQDYLDKHDLSVAPYRTYRKCRETIENLGFGSFLEMLRAVFGEPEDNAKLARRGDLVAKWMPAPVEMHVLGICIGAKAMFKTITGPVYFNLSECDMTWRVE